MTQRQVFIILVIAWLPNLACGHDDGFSYPSAGGSRSYGHPDIYCGDQDLELSRIRRELRNQRLRESAQQRLQKLDLLRQQATTSQQISAEQACYYRSTGGFELCCDLFDADKAELTACEALVAKRNPGCTGEELRHTR